MKKSILAIAGALALILVAHQSEGANQVIILNQLPAGNDLILVRTGESISPQNSLKARWGDTIQLKGSPSDFINFYFLGKGGDKKGGRLTSVCDANFINSRASSNDGKNDGKCAIHFVE